MDSGVAESAPRSRLRAGGGADQRAPPPRPTSSEDKPECKDAGVTVSFTTASADLDTNARGALNGVATWLKMRDERTIKLAGLRGQEGERRREQAAQRAPRRRREGLPARTGDRAGADHDRRSRRGVRSPAGLGPDGDRRDLRRAHQVVEEVPPPVEAEPEPEPAPPPVVMPPPAPAPAPIAPVAVIPAPPPPPLAPRDAGGAEVRSAAVGRRRRGQRRRRRDRLRRQRRALVQQPGRLVGGADDLRVAAAARVRGRVHRVGAGDRRARASAAAPC